MSEWKPIETAPEGDWIIAWDPENQTCAFALNIKGSPAASETRQWINEDLLPISPTHWMPLPAPPKP